jgi:uncharacterized membrane protein
MQEAPVTVAFAEFDDPTAAKNALRTLQQMERDGSIDVLDAGVVEKADDGKIKITDTAKHARRKDLGVGALVGGVVGVIFPPSIIASAAVGGAAGAIVGHLRHDSKFDTKEMKEAADKMEPGSSALVAVIEQRWMKQLQIAAEGYHHLFTQGVQPETAATMTTAVTEGDAGEAH